MNVQERIEKLQSDIYENAEESDLKQYVLKELTNVSNTIIDNVDNPEGDLVVKSRIERLQNDIYENAKDSELKEYALNELTKISFQARDEYMQDGPRL